MKAGLGGKERELLLALQEDSECSVRELAKTAGLPLSTAHEKIARLKRDGFIKKCCAVVDARKAGIAATGFVFIKLSGAKAKSNFRKKLSDSLASLPNVQEVHFTSGDSDLIVKVRAETVDSLGKLVSEKIRPLPGVESARTEIVFESVKEGTSLPL
ncbi:putative HTH-type transcriptional regulator [uncultured archaeon]|nr:putative HTH-type transcriptional regulator [uncultured archaeon]